MNEKGVLASADIQRLNRNRQLMAYGYNLLFGQPNAYITLNPPESYSQVLVQLAGVDIPIQLVPHENFPSYFERLRISSSNSVALAQAFQHFMETFIDKILRFNKITSYQRRSLFGTVLAYFFNSEVTARLNPHAHGMLWIQELNETAVQEYLKSPQSREQMKHMLDSIFQSTLPNEEFDIEISIERKNEETKSKLEIGIEQKDPEILESVPGGLANTALHYCPPLDLNDPNWKDIFKKRRVSLVRLVGIHEHKLTCKKKKGCDCRLGYPKHLQDITVVKNDGSIEFKRDHPMVVQRNDAVLVALGCNVAIYYIPSGEGKFVVYYITKYITKHPLKCYELVSLLQAAHKAHKDALDLTNEPRNAEKETRSLVRKCLNKLNASRLLSSVEAARTVLNLDHDFKSHLGVPFLCWDFHNYLNSLDPSNDEEHSISFSIQKEKESKEFYISSQVRDYVYSNQDSICPYEFIMWYERKPKKNAQSESGLGRPRNHRISLLKEHPQSQSHEMIRRSHFKIPYLIGGKFPERPKENEPISETHQKYAKFFLSLFSPWKNLIGNPDESWWDVYLEFKNNCKPWVHRIEENLFKCCEIRKDAIIHAKSHIIPDSDENDESENAETIETLCSVPSETLNESDTNIKELLIEELISYLEVNSDVGLTSTMNSFVQDAHELLKTHRYRKGSDSEQRQETPFVKLPIAPSNLSLTNLEFKKNIEERINEINVSSERPSSTTDCEQWTNLCLLVDQSFQSIQSTSSASIEELETWEKWQTPPSIEQTIQHWKLNLKQRFCVRIILDHHLRQRNDPNFDEQLLLAIFGPPGTGKSYVDKSIKWFLFQHNMLHESGTSSYSARAAANLRTVHSTSMTSCKYYGINPRKGSTLVNEELVRPRLDRLQMAFTDEISMCPPHHYAIMSQHVSLCKSALDNKYKDNSMKPFHGVNHVHYGDFHQLPPVGTSLITGYYEQLKNRTKPQFCGQKAIPMTEEQQDSVLGQNLFNQINHVVNLDQVERVLNTPGGIRLREFCYRLRHELLTDQDFYDLNDKAIGNESGPALNHSDWKEMIILTPRQAVRTALSADELLFQAKSENKQVYSYKSIDSFAGTGRPLPERLQAMVYRLNYKQCGHSCHHNIFFVGMKVEFVSNRNPEIGYINHGIAEVVMIIPHPEDEEIIRTQRDSFIVKLSRLPLSVIVRIDSGPEFQLDGFQKRCIPLLPKDHTFAIKFNKPIPLLDMSQTLRVKRTTFDILPIKCVTDYFSQGLTFKGIKVLIDLRPPPPPVSSTEGESVNVMISRVQEWDQFALLAPLWKNKEDAPAVIKQLRQRWKFSNDVKAADIIFREREILTLQNYSHFFDEDVEAEIDNLMQQNIQACSDLKCGLKPRKEPCTERTGNQNFHSKERELAISKTTKKDIPDPTNFAVSPPNTLLKFFKYEDNQCWQDSLLMALFSLFESYAVFPILENINRDSNMNFILSLYYRWKTTKRIEEDLESEFHDMAWEICRVADNLPRISFWNPSYFYQELIKDTAYIPLFVYTRKEIISCDGCGLFKEKQYDKYFMEVSNIRNNSLALDVQGIMSRSYSIVECSDCGSERLIDSILHAPDVLVITTPRVAYDAIDSYTFEDHFTIQDTEFVLSSVILSQPFHFMTLFFSNEFKQWFFYDDNANDGKCQRMPRIRNISELKLHLGEETLPYMFFYHKKI